jgi:hypothetical protein
MCSGLGRVRQSSHQKQGAEAGAKCRSNQDAGHQVCSHQYQVIGVRVSRCCNETFMEFQVSGVNVRDADTAMQSYIAGLGDLV